ncbi:MAG: hypothetical protein OXR67_09300 [Chloroflexota bacterium]|nr:hypothetical protein [Chloroflexota bacterium]
MERNQLLLAINRCPEVSRARSTPNHPCSQIVGSQQAGAFQSPEPWRGHIETAPILFISSNPSISGEETFPPINWTDKEVVAHYQGCFDKGVPGPYQIDAKAFNRVQFWREVRGRATEILGRVAVQGADFALTELVHCKSKSEYGVTEALPLCTRKWLEPVLEQSCAKVLVVLGKHAETACSGLWSLDSSRKVHLNVQLFGSDRAIVFLPHPNARQKRNLASQTTEREQLRLRALAVQ